MSLLLRLLVVSALATPLFAQSQETLPFVRVSPRNPHYFETSDGKPFIPIGLNLISPPGSRTGDPKRSMETYETWLRKLSENRGNYARFWLSRDFWDVEHEKAGQYDEAMARRIDEGLALCRKYGIRTKLTIEHFREIDPKDVRQSWASKPLHHVSRGGTAATIADWFNNEPSRAQFRKKLDFYAGRYKSDPTVFGWELWNEVNAVRGGDYMAWTEAMLSELHARFPRNLCMQSLGSFDHERQLDLYRRHSLMKGNNVAQVHRYLDLGAQLEVSRGPVDVLAADAVRELRSWEPGKPVILAECGAVEPKHTGPFKLYAKDKAGMILHDVLFAPFFAGAAGPGQVWHWDAYVDRNDLWHHYGRFAAAVEGIDPVEEQFFPDELRHDRLRIYALVGKKETLLLWLRDKNNTWQSELAEGKAPETITGMKLDFAPYLKFYLGKGTRARAYDPWTSRWTPLPIEDGRIFLPEFSRSLVIRIERQKEDPAKRPRPVF